MTEEYKAKMSKRILPILETCLKQKYTEPDYLLTLPYEIIDKTSEAYVFEIGNVRHDAVMYLVKVNASGLGIPRKYPGRYIGCHIAFNGLELTKNVTQEQFENLIRTKVIQAKISIDDLVELDPSVA